MNTHVGLVQRLESERLFDAASDHAEIVPLDEKIRSNGHKRLATDEAMRLVQQVFHQSQEPPRLVVFAGVEHGNGCSEVGASVAETLAKTTRGAVVLVDANFRSPALPGLFGRTCHRGLTDALFEEGPIRSFAQLVADNLWLLSSGSLTPDSPSLLSSMEFRERLEELRQSSDFVIIDAPPLKQYSDATAIGLRSDGVVLVLEANSTRLEAASAVAANLRSLKVPILAAVLNKHSFPISEKIYNRL